MAADPSQIHRCARDGNITGIAEALASGADVDARDPRGGFTPLMEAAQSDDAGEAVIQMLIDRGADVNAFSSDRTVLSLALGSGTFSKIKLIIDSGADILYLRPSGYDALIDAMHGHDISADGDLLQTLALLIQRGARLNTISDYSESTLSVASNMGRFDAIRLLLRAGADPAPLRWNPLMHAIALGSVADVREQLDDAPDLSARDFWSRTPWLLSLQTGDVAKAKLLLAAGANPNDRGRCGKTPLMYPITNGHVEMLSWLLSLGLGPDALDEFGGSALMEAAELGATQCVQILLDAGANIHLMNHSEAAIKMATNLAVVRLLVGHGADLNDISDEMRAKLTHLHHRGDIDASNEQYAAAKHRRFGQHNPEKMNLPFWRAMILSGARAVEARQRFHTGEPLSEPVWCFKRFGKSINEVPDGRIVEIGGEHEDFYDPDFCIYNDIVVHHPNGTFDIYGYPKAIFPPTDFHTATLIDEHIYVIGSLGYQGERHYGVTPVFRINVATLQVQRVETFGEQPGWIYQHKTSNRGNHTLEVTGGKILRFTDGKESEHDNVRTYSLDLGTMSWRANLA